MSYAFLGLSILLALIVLRQKILLERLRQEIKDRKIRHRRTAQAHHHLFNKLNYLEKRTKEQNDKDELVGVSLEKFNILCIPCQSCGKITEISNGSLHMYGIPKCWNCGEPVAILMKKEDK